MATTKQLDILAAMQRSSPCKRLQVGAVLIDKLTGECVSGAYNGHNNVCAGGEPGACGCKHAEALLLKKAVELGCVAPIYRMLVTTSPCLACAHLIIHSKIILEVAYLEYYRNTMPLTLLLVHNIACVKVNRQ